MYFLITTKYLHLSRLSLWWRSFFRSHFAKSPFKPDELRSPKRWQLLLQKQNLQPTDPFPLQGDSLCYNHGSSLAATEERL